jgi:hypothetical protein
LLTYISFEAAAFAAFCRSGLTLAKRMHSRADFTIGGTPRQPVDALKTQKPVKVRRCFGGLPDVNYFF